MISFQEKVYTVVAKIPKGKVMTYAEVAQKIGNPQAYRAVASALKRNFTSHIPCHRVIRSDKKIGDYNRGGSRAKYALLKSEGVHVSSLIL